MPAAVRRSLAAFLLISALSAAAETGLVTAVSLSDLEDWIMALDDELLWTEDNPEHPYVGARTSSGLIYMLRGYACDPDEGCLGMETAVVFDLDGVEVSPTRLNQLNQDWAAMKVTLYEDGLVASRYEVLDHGRTRDNLFEAINVALDNAEVIGEQLYGAAPNEDE